MRYTLFICLLLFATAAFGQVGMGLQPDLGGACDPEAVISEAEQMPQYKGGMKGFEKNLNLYVKPAPELEGELPVRMLISCEGEPSGYQTLKYLDKDFQEELVFALDELQSWKPGAQGGEPVDVLIVVTLKISNGKIEVVEP